MKLKKASIITKIVVIALLVYGLVTLAVLMGKINDVNAEKDLLRQIDLPDLEVLAAGHHGSKSATSAELLDALTPETVCISVGSNSYGHPAEEMLRRLGERECAVYRTDLHGNIRISWNEGDQHGKESNQK